MQTAITESSILQINKKRPQVEVLHSLIHLPSVTESKIVTFSNDQGLNRIRQASSAIVVRIVPDHSITRLATSVRIVRSIAQSSHAGCVISVASIMGRVLSRSGSVCSVNRVIRLPYRSIVVSPVPLDYKNTSVVYVTN